MTAHCTGACSKPPLGQVRGRPLLTRDGEHPGRVIGHRRTDGGA